MSRTNVRLALVALVALVWLNQSPIFQLFGAHTPLRAIYAVGGDDRLLYATAGAILGKPFDANELATSRGAVPTSFRSSGISEGRWNVPYRDVPLEYPPANLPFILVPRLGSPSLPVYALFLGALMGGLLVWGAGVGARLRRSFGEGPLGELHALGMSVLLLLLHGSIATQRLDAICAIVLVLFVDAFVRRRDFAIGAWAGLLCATKLVPVLLLPALLVIDRRDTKRSVAAWRSLALGFVLTTVLGFGIVVFVPESLDQFLGYHAARGLQVESTLGVAYGLVHLALGSRAATVHDFGSFNFAGSTADLLAKASLPITAGVVLAIVLVVGRPAADERGRARRLLASAYAITIALWLTGKVFSPQYLTWALPLAIAFWGRGRMRVFALTGSAMLVSQVYFRLFYRDVVAQTGAGLTFLVLRQIVLVALLVVVVDLARRGPRELWSRRANATI